MLKGIAIFFVLSALTAACSVREPRPIVEPPGKAEEFALSMERTGCYGRCPAYIVSVDDTGGVDFNGKGFTKTMGSARGSISSEQVAELVDEVRKSGFFSLQSSYASTQDGCPSVATDMPTVAVRIKLGHQDKTTSHDLGCWEKRFERGKLPGVYPKALYDLENRIDEIAGTNRWIDEP